MSGNGFFEGTKNIHMLKNPIVAFRLSSGKKGKTMDVYRDSNTFVSHTGFKITCRHENDHRKAPDTPSGFSI
jgi:hypothetical protein